METNNQHGVGNFPAHSKSEAVGNLHPEKVNRKTSELVKQPPSQRVSDSLRAMAKKAIAEDLAGLTEPLLNQNIREVTKLSNIPLQKIEGTGAQISEYAKQHPKDRFRLTVIEGGDRPKPFDQAKWDDVIASIKSVMGNLPSLPDDATSTDSLYD